MYVCVGSSESDYCNSPSEKGKKEEAIRDATWANVRLTSGIRVCICVASKLGRSAMHRIALNQKSPNETAQSCLVCGCAAGVWCCTRHTCW